MTLAWQSELCPTFVWSCSSRAGCAGSCHGCRGDCPDLPSKGVGVIIFGIFAGSCRWGCECLFRDDCGLSSSSSSSISKTMTLSSLMRANEISKELLQSVVASCGPNSRLAFRSNCLHSGLSQIHWGTCQVSSAASLQPLQTYHTRSSTYLTQNQLQITINQTQETRICWNSKFKLQTRLPQWVGSR